MYITVYEVVGLLAAVIAMLMLGSRNVRFQLSMYTLQIWLIAGETILFAIQHKDWHFYLIGVTLILQRALLVPGFLNWIVNRIDGVKDSVKYSKKDSARYSVKDSGMVLRAPLTMHLSILLFGLGFFVATHLPLPEPGGGGIVIASATASISLLFSGLIMMLTRRLAISQIIGFITLENGVYLFALTQTNGLPILIEMAVLIDILGAVILLGVLIFDINRQFEHIDVTRLTNLKF
jgi:hydrogenase-4 component E